MNEWRIPWRCWREYLGAILLGNAIYFLVLMPLLPRSLRHEIFQVDLGLLVDFFVCVAVYAVWRAVKH